MKFTPRMLALLLLLCLPMNGLCETASLFEARAMEPDAQPALRYWLYAPTEPAEGLPLIVYLHGGSGKGDDLNLLTDADGFPRFLQTGRLGDLRAYVVMPQLPANLRGWADAADALEALIRSLESELSIDEARVSLTGHSMGGTGAWSLAAAKPALFSRVAPLSGSIRCTPEALSALKTLSIWAFVGSADTIVPPQPSEDAVKRLQIAGADARLTILENADHFSVPVLAYLDESHDLVDWLCFADFN